MLDQTDTLYTFAEIAATLAGFAALAGVIGSRGSRTGPWNFLNLWTVVLVSLALVCFSLIPVVLAEFRISPSAAWRLSSAITLLAMSAAVYIGLRYVILPHASALDWFGKGVVFPVAGLSIIALVGNASGISERNAAAIFLTFLLLNLALVVVMFLRLLLAAFMPSSE